MSSTAFHSATTGGVAPHLCHAPMRPSTRTLARSLAERESMTSPERGRALVEPAYGPTTGGVAPRFCHAPMRPCEPVGPVYSPTTGGVAPHLCHAPRRPRNSAEQEHTPSPERHRAFSPERGRALTPERVADVRAARGFYA